MKPALDRPGDGSGFHKVLLILIALKIWFDVKAQMQRADQAAKANKTGGVNFGNRLTKIRKSRLLALPSSRPQDSHFRVDRVGNEALFMRCVVDFLHDFIFGRLSLKSNPW